jgi:hypothetical protein
MPARTLRVVALTNEGRPLEARTALDKSLEIEPWNEEAKALRLPIESGSLDPQAAN